MNDICGYQVRIYFKNTFLGSYFVKTNDVSKAKISAFKKAMSLYANIFNISFASYTDATFILDSVNFIVD